MKSDSIKNIAKAMAEIQSKLPKVKFDKSNNYLGTGYATLGALIDAAIPVIATVGLSVLQFPTSHEGRIGVRTMLLHESGEYIEDVIYLVPESQKVQSVNQSAGVTITYLRRYSFAAILGLVSEEDTDGDVTDQSQYKATEGAKKVMERVWSLEQMEEVVSLSNGQITEHIEASVILDLSVLPENAPVKTVASWFKHYLKSEASTPLLKAAEANEAYQKAKKTGGK